MTYIKVNPKKFKDLTHSRVGDIVKEPSAKTQFLTYW